MYSKIELFVAKLLMFSFLQSHLDEQSDREDCEESSDEGVHTNNSLALGMDNADQK